jgi:hypothetical protein
VDSMRDSFHEEKVGPTGGPFIAYCDTCASLKTPWLPLRHAARRKPSERSQSSQSALKECPRVLRALCFRCDYHPTTICPVIILLQSKKQGVIRAATG